VTVRVRPLSGNAVISGFFIDPIGTVSTMVATPVITPNGGTISAGQSISISCATAGATIRYTTDGSTPTTLSPVYTASLTLKDSATISARGFASGMIDSAVASASFSVLSSTSPATATFLGLDATLQGNWKGLVGTEAYVLPTDAQSLPANISIAPAGKNDWVWSSWTTESRALQRANLNSRSAACAYGSNFTYDVNLLDGKTHTLSLYCVDWDRLNRIQSVDVLDYASKTVLQSFSLSSFGNGIYLKYAVKGHVLIRFTLRSGANAVVSGIFVDPSSTQL
jgi:hypothetical protein